MHNTPRKITSNDLKKLHLALEEHRRALSMSQRKLTRLKWYTTIGVGIVVTGQVLMRLGNRESGLIVGAAIVVVGIGIASLNALRAIAIYQDIADGNRMTQLLEEQLARQGAKDHTEGGGDR